MHPIRNKLRLPHVVALVLVLVGVGLARGLYVRLTDPEGVRRQAEAYLQQYFNVPVVIGAAEFSLRDGVRLFDVAVGSTFAASDSSARPVFYCREVEASVRLASLARGDFRIDSVVAEEPSLTIVRRAVDGATNISDIIRGAAFEDDDVTARLPRIELRDATVRVLQHEGNQERLIENIALTFRGRSAERNSRFYDVVWHRFGPDPASGHSQIDLESHQVRNVYGGLPWVSLEAVMIAVNARYDAVGAWYDLLGLSGSVRATDYTLGTGEDGERRSATLELNDATLAIPLTQDFPGRPAAERYLRFEGVFGRVELTEGGVRADFEGRFHGSRCRATATLAGEVEQISTLDDVDFDVQMIVDDLELPRPAPEGTPAEDRFIKRWPKLAGFYRDFDPGGRVDIELEASKRAGIDEPVKVRRWMVRARDAHASARYFPVRVYHLTGSVEAGSGGVFLRNLAGVHGSGDVRVDGWFAHPHPESKAHLSISGSGVPIDSELCDAVAAKYIDVCAQFSPKGGADVQVDMTRPETEPGTRSPWESTTTVDLRGVSLVYQDFPYPIHGVTGIISGAKGVWTLKNLVGTAGDGQVCIDGRIVAMPPEQKSTSVRVEAENVSIDDVLMSALSAGMRESIAAFHPGGIIDVRTTIERGAGEAGTLHYTDVTLKDAHVRHDDFPLLVEGVTGIVRILPGRVVFDRVWGRSGGATLLASGQMLGDWRRPTVDVTVTGQDLQLGERLRAAFPAKAQRALADWTVMGHFSAEMDVRRRPAEPTPTVTATVYLDGNELRHSAVRLPMKDVRAVLSLAETGIRAKGASMRIGSADLVGDLFIQGGAKAESGVFTFKASNVTLDGRTETLLPLAVRDSWDRLGFSGAVDLEVDRLVFARPDSRGPREWTVSGRVHLFDVGLSSPTEMRQLSGVVAVDGLLFNPAGGTSLRGQLSLEQGLLDGRRFANVRSPWSYVANDSAAQLNLQDVRGEVYGGNLTARLNWIFDGPKAVYDLAAMVHGMELHEFLNARRARRGEEPVEARGLVDARLQLSGVADAPATRRGSGRVEVTEGRIYRLPIMLGILNVLNFSVPRETAFDRVEVEFLVAGNQVELAELALRGQAAALVGSGVMSWPDTGLNLTLVSTNPNRWRRIPVLTTLVERTSNEIIELQITGPLSRPSVRPRPIPALSDEFRKLFQKKSPKRSTTEERAQRD